MSDEEEDIELKNNDANDDSFILTISNQTRSVNTLFNSSSSTNASGRNILTPKATPKAQSHKPSLHDESGDITNTNTNTNNTPNKSRKPSLRLFQQQ